MTVRLFIVALTAALPAAAQTDTARSTYDARIVGVWQGDGGTCTTQKGSWAFGPDTLRGNATTFALTGIHGTADRVVAEVTRPGSGAPLNLILRPTGPDTLAINGPGIAADVTRCPAGDDAIVASMEEDARAYDTARFKPVRLQGITCGDNCYVDYTAQREGAGDGQALCTAPECAAWFDAGTLPDGFRDTIVGAEFGTAPQRDAAGTVMDPAFRAITAFGPPDVGMPNIPLPLPPGTYVDPALACGDAPNAALRTFTGAGISGSATRDCRLYLPKRTGQTYSGIQTCTDTYSGQPSTWPATVTIDGPLAFTFDDGAGAAQSFRFCNGD